MNLINQQKEKINIIGKLKFLKRFDYLQLFAISALMITGLIFLYTADIRQGNTSYFTKQILWICISFGAWLMLSFMDYKNFKYLAIPAYIFTIFLLIIVLIPGIGELKWGARRWLDLKVMKLQPSELAKISTLMIISLLASQKWFKINKFKHLTIIGAATGLPFLLILIEPDLGSSLVLAPMFIFVVFAAGYRWRNIIIVAILAIIFGTTAVFNEVYQVKPLLKNYQLERIKVFLDPNRDPRGRGWNQLQAKNAIGSGGFAGKGLMQGTVNGLGYLPKNVSHNDFIFSVIGEEAGFLGTSGVTFMFLLLIISALRTAVVAEDKFGRFFSVGVAGVIFMHSFVNMGMSIGIAPVTGLPLPLVSYGGSFMLSTMIMLGMMQSIYAKRKTSKIKKDEF